MTGNKSQAPDDEAQIHAPIDRWAKAVRDADRTGHPSGLRPGHSDVRCASTVPFSGFGCPHGNLGDVFGVV
jgi:hypothetical protein